MIGVFPTLYPDELIYSCLARYYVRSGYLVYRSVAEDLFEHPTQVPSIELCNPLTEDALKHLSAAAGGITYLMYRKHTMFDYYARCMAPDKRLDVFQSLISGDIAGASNKIARRQFGERYLRYCPICAQEDRTQYGETYWHRAHQMPEVSICPFHGCVLYDSTVRISSRVSPDFVPAETEALNVCIEAADEKSAKIARYVYDVFSADYNIGAALDLSAVFYTRALERGYFNPQKKMFNLQAWISDISTYYGEESLFGFTEPWQIHKLLTGQRHSLYEVAIIAMHLDILPEELSLTDYAEAPHATRAPRKPSPHRCRAIDWDTLDNNVFLCLQSLISTAYDMKSINRPIRITPKGLGRRLGLREGQLKNMPKCSEYIAEHYETQELYIARSVAWAYDRLLIEGNHPITATSIVNKLNSTAQRVRRSIPYVSKYTSDENSKAIVTLFS